MKILITGANGFLAKNLINNYVDNHEAVLLDRNDLDLSVDSESFKKEVHSRTDYSDCLDGVNCVVHCAARVHVMADESSDPLTEYREVNTEGTLNLARQAVRAGVKRFIFISSIKVNGENTNDKVPFDETSPRLPMDFYGQSKAEAEVALIALSKETGIEVVIIRPTLVYGAGVKGNFLSLMRLVSKGFPLPFGCINNNLRSLVSVKNLTSLISVCLDHPKAANEVFLVSDDCDVSTSCIIKHMSRALSKKCFLIPIPTWCYRLTGKILDKECMVDRLVGSLQVDISHTKETLGWVPLQSLENGFKEATDFINNTRQNKS